MDSIKFFGVNIDDEQTWKDHISNVCKKAAMWIAIFNKVKYILNTKCMHALYCALILPNLAFFLAFIDFPACRKSAGTLLGSAKPKYIGLTSMIEKYRLMLHFHTTR